MEYCLPRYTSLLPYGRDHSEYLFYLNSSFSDKQQQVPSLLPLASFPSILIGPDNSSGYKLNIAKPTSLNLNSTYTVQCAQSCIPTTCPIFNYTFEPIVDSISDTIYAGFSIVDVDSEPPDLSLLSELQMNWENEQKQIFSFYCPEDSSRSYFFAFSNINREQCPVGVTLDLANKLFIQTKGKEITDSVALNFSDELIENINSKGQRFLPTMWIPADPMAAVRVYWGTEFLTRDREPVSPSYDIYSYTESALDFLKLKKSGLSSQFIDAHSVDFGYLDSVDDSKYSQDGANNGNENQSQISKSGALSSYFQEVRNIENDDVEVRINLRKAVNSKDYKTIETILSTKYTPKLLLEFELWKLEQQVSNSETLVRDRDNLLKSLQELWKKSDENDDLTKQRLVQCVKLLLRDPSEQDLTNKELDQLQLYTAQFFTSALTALFDKKPTVLELIEQKHRNLRNKIENNTICPLNDHLYIRFLEEKCQFQVQPLLQSQD